MVGTLHHSYQARLQEAETEEEEEEEEHGRSDIYLSAQRSFSTRKAFAGNQDKPDQLRSALG
jgi:hypothetical protein